MTTRRHRIDVEDIRATLAGRAADLAQLLLGEPTSRTSRELRWGQRGSLAIAITGAKAGTFFDHEIEKGGDLIALIMRERNCGFADALNFARDFCSDHVVRAASPKANGKQPLGEIVATYDYVDEDGTLLFQVCRYEPKDFRQRRPDPQQSGKWIRNVKDVKPVPYRLLDLAKSSNDIVVIVEGEKDANRLWQLGIPATCNAGGAGKWHANLSKFFKGRDVVVIPDRDPQKKHSKTGEPMFHPDGRRMLPGQDHGQAIAAALQGIAARVRVLELWQSWPEMPLKGDVSDWIDNGGTAEQLYALIEKLSNWSPPAEHGTAQEAKPAEEESEISIEIARLAKLPAIKYEQERKASAEALGCRASVLDRLVQDERGHLGGCEAGMQGRAISFPEPELWRQPVDGAALLDDISKAIGRHVVMPETSRDACALWTAHTFLLDCTMISPRLAITSPTRGCGKTTALDVISQLVMRPLPAANVSASAIFRVVEGFRPTLLIDEADTFLKDNDELRGVLNSGHRKGGAVLRNVGDDHQPRAFSTYGACAIALIGQLPGTLTDRSVPITLTRRKSDETITPFRLDRVEHLLVLMRKLARWCRDNAATIAATEPTMPAGLYNRAADNWAPLLSIAQVAGGGWLARGERAALKSVAADIEDASRLELVLADIRAIFASRAVDRIPSAVLAEALAEIEGRPWAEYGRSEKPITPGKLARLLKPLAIVPDSIRVDEKRTPKGYYFHQFKEAFARYLGPEGTTQPQQRNDPDEMGTSELLQSATADTDVAVQKCEKSANDGPCCGVADQKGLAGEKMPHVTFLGIELSAPCEHCGESIGIVHHVRDNRHLDRPSANLHEACVASWFAGQEGNRKDDGDVQGEDRTCAQCHGEIDGKERRASVRGSSVWLHPECQRFWLAALNEGHGPEGEKAH